MVNFAANILKVIGGIVVLAGAGYGAKVAYEKYKK